MRPVYPCSLYALWVLSAHIPPPGRGEGDAAMRTTFLWTAAIGLLPASGAGAQSTERAAEVVSVQGQGESRTGETGPWKPAVAQLRPGDGLASEYLRRIELYRRHVVDAHWDGTFELDTK